MDKMEWYDKVTNNLYGMYVCVVLVLLVGCLTWRGPGLNRYFGYISKKTALFFELNF